MGEMTKREILYTIVIRRFVKRDPPPSPHPCSVKQVSRRRILSEVGLVLKGGYVQPAAMIKTGAPHEMDAQELTGVPLFSHEKFIKLSTARQKRKRAWT